MSRNVIPSSASGTNSTGAVDWPALPTETEIYILPDGSVVVADLPTELAVRFAELGAVEPCRLAHPDVTNLDDMMLDAK